MFLGLFLRLCPAAQRPGKDSGAPPGASQGCRPGGKDNVTHGWGRENPMPPSCPAALPPPPNRLPTCCPTSKGKHLFRSNMLLR